MRRYLMPEDESGNITITFVILILIISVLLVGVLDFGGALTRHTVMQDKLEVAVDNSSKTSSTSMYVKNQTNPEREIATEVVKSLRANGCDDKVDVWVKEASQSQVGDAASRVIGVWVEVSGTYHPMTAGNVIGDMEVKNADGFYLTPYSADSAWRPGNEQNREGRYTAESGTSTITYTHATVPDQVNEQITKGIQSLSGNDA